MGFEALFAVDVNFEARLRNFQGDEVPAAALEGEIGVKIAQLGHIAAQPGPTRRGVELVVVQIGLGEPCKEDVIGGEGIELEPAAKHQGALAEGVVHCDFDVIGERRQAAFLQGTATLSQRLQGFKRGHKYVVSYYENARAENFGPGGPYCTVKLGGQVVVARHRVEPVEAKGTFTKHWRKVVSAPFSAPADGDYTLEFSASGRADRTLLLDGIEVKEVSESALLQAAQYLFAWLHLLRPES